MGRDRGVTWRDVLGLSPELEAAAPGHGLCSVIFWLVAAVCALAYAWIFLR
jgi:hypothetical protein